ncbi:cytochrome c3 family protein [Thiovibrio frasassiensis]|uniref:Cytochrome c family protein n=1 Tax=Thiovibrio frasassiensis TaxID=2984131 RepID=A0A9X4RMI8_9BACT|nr:cytochrome c3 family protein [Thiovibrio frasassiensis]MDG4476228.1 cytochrome c family protein [Thiovibrio frasassiensis]
MKKTVICSAAFALVFGFATVSAFAGDVVVYDTAKAMGGSKVTFNHKAHGTKLGDCKKCHEGTPAKIAMSKDLAHKALCKDCHAKMSGPTKCNECHKK